jgi:hypothetical protein
MARITVRPDLTGVVHMVAIAPTPKVKDLTTGEIATDRDGETPLYTIQLMELYGPQAQIIKVTVPFPGLGDLERLTPGAQVRLTGLIASPWGNVFGGQVQVGLAYRAEAVTVVTPAAVQPAPASAKADAKAS